ncbi:phage recombination protein Bet, partial [Candidatus Woesearchaeota archaeon]|nr:phage recombination protein Bet [Candidatus Woesearchaeota archaeon]
MSNEISVVYNVGENEVKLTPKIVSEYLTGGANITMPEFKMFSELCKARGLNPFLKEAYIIKYGNAPAQIVVGKDAILKRAIVHPDFDGREQGVIVVNSNGETIERKGTFFLQSETLVGGWAKVYRKNWKFPVYITVAFSEVAQTKRDGSLNQQWATKGATMIEKVALVRALREAFVEDVSGMYDADEMGVELPSVTIEQEPQNKQEPENKQ